MTPSPDPLFPNLQDWQVRPPADPDFRARVWERINRRIESWPGYLRAHRLGWSAAALMTLAVASVTGRAIAEARAEADRDALVVTYLTELDPRVQATLRH